MQKCREAKKKFSPPDKGLFKDTSYASSRFYAKLFAWRKLVCCFALVQRTSEKRTPVATPKPARHVSCP